MSDAVELQTRDDYLEVKVQGKLTKSFYQQFVPAVEEQIKQHGKLRILIEMHDFHGWTAGALWEDIKFDMKHWNHISRLAIVGETRWEEGMAAFCRPFTSAKVQYFDHSKLDEARKWVTASE